MPSHIKLRARELPDAIRNGIRDARRQRGWSQAELGQRIGLPQMHISGIETGRIVPRFDTLLELVRILGFDLVLVPRQVLPVVEAVITRHHREQQNPNAPDEDLPLYAIDDAGEGDPGPHV